MNTCEPDTHRKQEDLRPWPEYAGEGEGGNHLINAQIVDIVGPAAGTGVSPNEGNHKVVYLLMSDGTHS